MARRVSLSGRVQGVWFRESCQRQASLLSVTGWVRNMDDGRVEVWMEGEEKGVDALVGWCRVGPSQALVTAVSVEEREPGGYQAFQVVA